MARTASVRRAAIRAGAEERRLAARQAKVRTVDSFSNFAAAVGAQQGQTIATAGTYGFNPITNERSLLEWMYRGSWVCQKAVDCVAEDMTRAGSEIGSTMPPEDAGKLKAAEKTWRVWPALQEAVKYARLYGGAIGFIMIDGQDPSTPLIPDRVGRGAFRGVHAMDRWQVNPSLGDIVNDYGPDMGLPRYYDVVTMIPFAPRARRIHHSRVFRLLGVPQPFWQSLNLNLWGCSVFEPLFDRLLAFDSTTQGTAQLVYRAYLRTYKVKDLRSIIAAGGEAYTALLQQMQLLKMFQGNEGISLVDAEDEFETHAYSFAGLDAVLLQFAQQLSGATGIPVTRLFGQSPAGMNATGESDTRSYYDTVNQRQECDFRSPLDRTYRVMCASEGIAVPDDFTFGFLPLWQMTEKEKAEVADLDARGVAGLVDAGIIGAQTALRELRTSGMKTGRFTNITDEEIELAEVDPFDPTEGEQLGLPGERSGAGPGREEGPIEAEPKPGTTGGRAKLKAVGG